MRIYTPQPYQPIRQSRIGLGQFSPFISPFDVMAPANGGPVLPAAAPAAAPAPQAQEDGLAAAMKTTAVFSGLALTGLSAATAYVGISFGSQKNAKTFDQIAGWTIGVIGAMSGLVRLVGTGVIIFSPPQSVKEALS